ncbi:hypothetical protein EC991_009621 [Linnemannia zychae]|nr:hypothetical protein EC991_009621 [Linnemannia zychae]
MRNHVASTTTAYSTARHFSWASPILQTSNRPGMTPPSPSRSSSKTNSATSTTNKDAKLDPDKIKGPGGLTMTQIGRLVQQSRARDLEHQQSKAGATGSSSSSGSSTGTKRK